MIQQPVTEELISHMKNDLQNETKKEIDGYIANEYTITKLNGLVFFLIEVYDTEIVFQYIKESKQLILSGIPSVDFIDFNLIHKYYKHIHRHLGILMTIDGYDINAIEGFDVDEYEIYYADYIDNYYSELSVGY